MSIKPILWVLLVTLTLGQVMQISRDPGPFDTVFNATNNRTNITNTTNTTQNQSSNNPIKNTTQNNSDGQGQNSAGNTFIPPSDVATFNYWMSLYGSRFGLNFQDPYRALVFN